MSNYYDVAQICLNGHVINSSSKKHPEHNKKFCDKCSTVTITNCPKCNTEIRGRYHVENVGSIDDYIVPAYCSNCGKPFPWTEAKIQTFKELIDEHTSLTAQEKDNMKKDIYDLANETPRTNLAITRLKKVAKTLGEEVRKLVVDISSEAIKKIVLEVFK